MFTTTTKFKGGIAVFMATVVLTTGSPAMAQSSGLLASAERAALAVEVEQDETVVRRRRSGGLALTGSVLAVAGVVLALRPPVCELDGLGQRRQNFDGDSDYQTFDYEAAYRDGQCDVRSKVTYLTYHGAVEGSDTYYHSDGYPAHSPGVSGDSPITKRTWNYVGWAAAAAGGTLMLFGLRGVEVPVRLDVAPTGGLRVSRSLGW